MLRFLCINVCICVIDCRCIGATWKLDESRNLLLKMCKILLCNARFLQPYCFSPFKKLWCFLLLPLVFAFFCYPFIKWLESGSECKFMQMVWGWLKNSCLRLRLRLPLLNSKDNVYKPNLSIKMFDNHRTYLLLFCLKA